MSAIDLRAAASTRRVFGGRSKTGDAGSVSGAVFKRRGRRRRRLLDLVVARHRLHLGLCSRFLAAAQPVEKERFGCAAPGLSASANIHLGLLFGLLSIWPRAQPIQSGNLPEKAPPLGNARSLGGLFRRRYLIPSIVGNIPKYGRIADRFCKANSFPFCLRWSRHTRGNFRAAQA